MNGKSDQHLKILEYIRNFRLLDDDFMTKCFEDNIEATEFILKIILNLDLKVKSVKTQDTIKNLYGRSVRLDIHAVSAEGKHFNNVELRIKNAELENEPLIMHSAFYILHC